MRWQDRAKCHGEYEIFDGVEDEDGRTHYPYLAEAKQICDECPVFDFCEAAGKKHHSGIWAGKVRR